MPAAQQQMSLSPSYSNDYHQIPATEKQITFAKQISQRIGVTLPQEAQRDRYALSRWIDANKIAKPVGQFSNYPSSKQVGFAERIARMKRRDIPQECFRDRTMMSKWIDANR
ncbi:hypothetical protein [Roseovarius aestuarii]|uniref:Uncharacterized protein n=1 Tax=Roseovarius aestuarii TaxID=475083 RepID=A0A1X7BXT9_9RHOB|nr:hypothetical protein [Roseovarius aestuarii]SMC14411.1 hypothetical protein ROA7745_04278 [Roseovarius aestuarii]